MQLSSNQDQPSQQPSESSENPEQSQLSFIEKTAARLAAERGETPDQEQAEPSSDEENTDDGGDQPEDESVGETDEESLGDQPESDESEEESEEAKPRGIEVDGKMYTEEDIRRMQTDRDSFEKDYRRKTQFLSRVRQEHEALGEKVSMVDSLFVKQAEQTIAQLESVDVSNFTQQEIAAWQNQLKNAKLARQNLTSLFGEVDKQVAHNRDKALEDQSKASIKVLEDSEPRWNDTFYKEIRDFVVESELYTAEEFADIADWRIIRGLISMMDSSKAAESIRQVERKKTPKPKKPARSANTPQKRNKNGRFQSAQQRFRESTNGREDGSFREMKARQLEEERNRS